MLNSKQLFDAVEVGLWDTQECGGCSLWFGTTEHQTGYVVGYGKRGVKLPVSKIEDAAQKAYIASLAERYQRDGAEGIGFWVDNDTLYVDPITHVTNEFEAKLMGITYGELAIYDLTNDLSIGLGREDDDN